ncbi:pantetheine-phosphate adenylyltransferase [Actinomycetaceae bacterium TAE3-ERU4]|nr:pantetheine-phosphate adenylyltransferase [Actinomycetaceae bacterium TAE3-ERU4]
MKIVLPGSYDPFTLGHLDIVQRSSKLASEVVVAVAQNSAKNYLFSAKERAELIALATENIENVRVEIVSGLLVASFPPEEYVLVKGVRTGLDFEYEHAQAVINQKIGQIETLYLPCDPCYAHISSSVVKELSMLGVDLMDYVPEVVERALKSKIEAGKRENV